MKKTEAVQAHPSARFYHMSATEEERGKMVEVIFKE